MKRILLSLLFISFAFLGNAQVLLNEIYFNPAAGEEEHIELYNSGATTENLNCYTVVVYYKTSNPDPVASGFFVINLPNINLPAGRWAVLGSGSPIDHQNGTYILGPLDVNWSAMPPTGYIKQFQLSGGTYTEITPIANLNDVLQITKGDAKYTTLLYKNGVLVNGLVINGGSSVPEDLKLMAPLTIPGDGTGTCGSFTLTFSTLANNQLEYLLPSIGQSNGASRTADGRCGTWDKSSRPAGITLGATNGASGTATGTIDVGGSINCNLNGNGKREATYFVVNNNTTASAYPLVLQIYQDQGTINGQLDAGDVILAEQQINTAPASGAPNTVYTVEMINTNRGTLVVGKSTAGCFETIEAISNGCSPLPVSFKSFTAIRNKSNVAVKWTTATEQNNKGFYIQRNSKGSWENIALVFSAAPDGNSTSDLSYSFNDLNNEKGVCQYRILQFDFDGRAKASDVRSVRGEAMAAKLLVYPNPSMDGKVSVVFEEGNGARNVMVSDMSGRMIKQYRNVSTNNISIEGLETGVYSIQVIDLSTAAITVEKVIIKKR
jgi:hypothetical protein